MTPRSQTRTIQFSVLPPYGYPSDIRRGLTCHDEQGSNVRVDTEQDVRFEVVTDHDGSLGIEMVTSGNTRSVLAHTGKHLGPDAVIRRREGDSRSHDGVHHMLVRFTDDGRRFLSRVSEGGGHRSGTCSAHESGSMSTRAIETRDVIHFAKREVS